jgi:hypothetical protein
LQALWTHGVSKRRRRDERQNSRNALHY